MLWNDIVPVWYYCLPVCSDGHKSYPYQFCGRVSDVSAVCPAAKKTEGIPVYSSTWNSLSAGYSNTKRVIEYYLFSEK